MEAIREIISSELIEGIINIPESFKNHKLEIIILPIAEEKNVNKEFTFKTYKCGGAVTSFEREDIYNDRL